RAGSQSSRLRFDELAATSPVDPRARCRELLDAIRWFMSGFDISIEEAGEIADRYESVRGLLPPDDPELVASELEVLTASAGGAPLTRNRHAGDVDTGDAARSPREHFFIYLRSLDIDREGLPDRFRQSLLRALAHYGIHELDRTPELEEALYRVFQ